MPTVVGVLVEYTRVVLPAVFFNRVETYLKQSDYFQSGRPAAWHCVCCVVVCMLVHCWVSGALLSWCCPVIDTVMDSLMCGCCWWLGCCVRTV